MNRLIAALSIGIFLLASPAGLAATPEQAKALVERAADYLRQVGPDKAFAAFDDTAGPFRDGDLYVFVHDNTGMIRAHGGFPSYIGRNTIWARDRDGKEFVREITQIRTSGWVNYKWLNPVSKAIEPKTVYVLRVDDFLICAGAYKGLPPGK